MSGGKKSVREKISIEIPQNGNLEISESQIKMNKPLFLLKLMEQAQESKDQPNKIAAEEMPFQATSTHPDIKSGKDGKGLGQNLAYHIGGKYIAFVKGSSNSKSSEGNDHCKVVVTSTSLEGIEYFTMKGAVQDLSFAHDFNYGILGAIDEFGSVHIKLCVTNTDSQSGSVGDSKKNEGKLKLSTWLFVDNQLSNPKSMHFHRLVWIPVIEHENATDAERYIDENNKYRISRILGITDGRSTEIWSIDEICTEHFNLDEEYKRTTKLPKIERSDIKKGRIQSRDCDVGRSPVVDLRISPCSEMLCTLDAFGEIRFYYLRENLARGSNLKLIKQFSTTSLDLSGCYPPAFSFFTFIDDYSKAVSDKLVWKCMVVGFDGNTILKIYDCQNWKELQRFDLDLNASSLGPFKAVVDPSGQCLILTSTTSNVMLVLKLGNLYSAIEEENGFEEVFLQGITSIHHLKISKPYDYGAIASITNNVGISPKKSAPALNDMDIRFLGFGADGIDACKINIKVHTLKSPTNLGHDEKETIKEENKTNDLIETEVSKKLDQVIDRTTKKDDDYEPTINMENTRKWVEKHQIHGSEKSLNKFCDSPKGSNAGKPLRATPKSPAIDKVTVIDKVTRLKPSTRNSFSPVHDSSGEVTKVKKGISCSNTKGTAQIPLKAENIERTTNDESTILPKSNEVNLINLNSMTPFEPRLAASTCSTTDNGVQNEINGHLSRREQYEQSTKIGSIPPVYDLLVHETKVAQKIIPVDRNDTISKKISNNDSDEDIVIENVELINIAKAKDPVGENQESRSKEGRPYTSTPERCMTPNIYAENMVEKLQNEVRQIKIDMREYQTNIQREIRNTLDEKIDEYSKTTRDELKQFIREESLDAYCSEKASINNTIRSSQTVVKLKNIMESFPSVTIDMKRLEELMAQGKFEEVLSLSASFKYPAMVLDVCKKIDLIRLLTNANRISKSTLHEVFRCLTANNSPFISQKCEQKNDPSTAEIAENKESSFAKTLISTLFDYLMKTPSQN